MQRHDILVLRELGTTHQTLSVVHVHGVYSVASKMSKKLYVGSLSWGMDDSGLHQAFEVFGAVTEAKVITDLETGRSRGFGFVTFEDDAVADEANKK